MNDIGKKVKDLRKYWKMTQEELSEGICSQAMISTIEKNENVYISAQLLYEISERLGVTIDYFFQDDTKTPTYNYVQETCNQINELIRKRCYSEAYDIVKIEKNNPQFTNVKHLKQYILWREAICVNYLKNDKETAEKLYDQALSLSKTSAKNYSVREIEILISKAILFNEQGRYVEADELYSKIIEYAKKSPALTNNVIFINIYYNAARNASLMKAFKKAYTLCEQGILTCNKDQSLFMLGYLYYLKGQVKFKLDGKFSEEMLRLYREALWVFEKNGDEKSFKYVSRKIKKVSYKI
ncbi:helix-turn-helix domain-containing protein [Anaerobacillus alkaliphilus]|uniref:Helix-turn-helix domain-containing protein n=1 Tax=Anaerobacillus alkaliphilus TaxID=1548597 RepID=A0A4Q0VWE8_9BACI|nr:helix-turn-helix domain-containing protein [Anaerobacillus alkaliphilus]RXJ02563.1 helix-turn-helix domain-containing protein [Anaerobacillus alkaliphilus]